MKSGQYDKAIRFFTKSQNLYPLPGAASLIAKCESMKVAAASPKPSQPSAAATAAKENRARQESGASSDMRGHTAEQANVAKEVLRAAKAKTDMHYKVLGIEKSASEAEIKRAYRKRSIKVHPDKNPAPEAEEAFKAVGLAYSTLMDPAKRETYDRFGDPDPDNGGAGGGGGGNPFAHMNRRGGGGGGGGQMDPEEVFRMFFSGGMGGGGMGGEFGELSSW